MLLDLVSVHVAGRGARAQVDLGEVALRQADEAPLEARCRTREDEQESVANGSSVPACPVRAFVLRRVAATMSNDVGPAGLSTRMIPLGWRARGGTTAPLPHRPAPRPRAR